MKLNERLVEAVKNMYSAYRSAYRSTHWSVYESAHWSTYWSAYHSSKINEQKVLEIIKNKHNNTRKEG